MLFEIVHITDYRYSQPVSEAYVEARLTPPSRENQEILSHSLLFQPEAGVSTYTDYFGNEVSFYSMTLRHEKLSISNRIVVRTKEVPLPEESLGVTVAEARQLVSSKLPDVFDYLQPTYVVPTGGPSTEWARRLLPSDAPLGKALDALNSAINTKFRYDSAATENWTPLATVWKQKAGVCQDFAHIMLSVLRTAGIPSRYVCGYIETDPPRNPDGTPGLVGSVATHAWVEALVPGAHWVALDPTNKQWCGQRHVAMSFGRDFSEAAPVRGTFKGSGNQLMKIKVHMKRMGD